ncbi:MAG: HD domain-containing protein [Chitinophagaceae bacterium]|nr:MAG: HD domain-containing protein [Chitinophagaceae bacterium]
MNKRKIINDPVYGFIKIPDELIFDIIEHPFFQRLRRIRQLGMTDLVYPGALHTRFHHALGAMHLSEQAINVLRWKGVDISEEESLGLKIAVLLHDIGHGPFSHSLESCIIPNTSHEKLSLFFMQILNKYFQNRLELAIEIFTGTYHRKFFHNLVSGQLDMDRMDYLNRDSFFTGVHEGVIGYDRIIKMLHVVDDKLVVEHKGIYSIEKFLIARRLMYWQVYLHKTVICAEQMLIRIFKRAKELISAGEKLFTFGAFQYFLQPRTNEFDLNNAEFANQFAQLDDADIQAHIKAWTTEKDIVLSELCKSILNRNLLHIEMDIVKIEPEIIENYKKKTAEKLKISMEDTEYFVFKDKTTNNAYNPSGGKIEILYKNGQLIDIAEASDHLNIHTLSATVTKHYLCYPKFILT